jgi:hypothetical protein
VSWISPSTSSMAPGRGPGLDGATANLRASRRADHLAPHDLDLEDFIPAGINSAALRRLNGILGVDGVGERVSSASERTFVSWGIEPQTSQSASNHRIASALLASYSDMR